MVDWASLKHTGKEGEMERVRVLWASHAVSDKVLQEIEDR